MKTKRALYVKDDTIDYRGRELRAIDAAFVALNPLSRGEKWRALVWLCGRLLPPLSPVPPGETEMRNKIDAALAVEPDDGDEEVAVKDAEEPNSNDVS